MLTREISSEVKRFETCQGAAIFRIPLLAFPSLWGYAYVALVDDEKSTPYRVLIDAGSGFGDSNQHLESGLQAISSQLGYSLGLSDLTHVLITHGHIDHIGGLTYVLTKTSAKVGVHELDKRNLTNYEERLTIVARRLRDYLLEAGLNTEKCNRLIDMYLLTKMVFHSVNVDFTFEKAGMRLGPFEILHVPGHCAGHVVIRLHDVLFSGDHILSHISPHQSPEQLTFSTGLEHYLASLDLLRSWANGISLTLPGHGEPASDLFVRIGEIEQLHQGRLEQVMKLLSQSHTIQDVSDALFGEVHGYNELLALEETGAHIEYLYQRGFLGIENLKELESGVGPFPIRYRSLTSEMSE
jgi:glyoxylase-like metal-dependent hydrolase (beta-lactamase superfamily II)